jgi:hypothetical protein
VLPQEKPTSKSDHAQSGLHQNMFSKTKSCCLFCKHVIWPQIWLVPKIEHEHLENLQITTNKKHNENEFGFVFTF